MAPHSKFVRTIAISGYVLAFIIPTYIFFSNRPGLSGSLADSQTAIIVLFPLAGLYAFTFLALQFLIGVNMRIWRLYFPGIMNFHRRQGLVASMMILIHPLMVLAGFGLDTVLKRQMVSSSQKVFITLAWLALLVLFITISTAVLAWKLQKFTQLWRYLHFGNYLVFGLVWVHSWFLGSDIQSSSLRYLWLLYASAAILSALIRVKRDQVLSWLVATTDSTN